MATFAFIILPFIPLIVWVLLVGWSANSTEGDVLLRVPATLLARMKMLWIPIAFGLVVLSVGAFYGESSWWTAGTYTAVWLVMLSIPISYTLTTVGIRTGRGRFRRWTEFAGVRRSASGALLQGGPRSSSYSIFLSGNREDDEFVLTLKNLIQDSYKGRDTVRDRMRSGDTQSAGDISTTSSISH